MISKPARNSTLRTNLIQLGVMVLVAIVIISLLLWAQSQNEINAARYYEEEQARLAAAKVAFTDLPPDQALALCRGEWDRQLSWSASYIPQAFAWSRQGVDGYYLQGTDPGSLRHFRCGADGTVRRGKRYERPGMAQLPAESSASSGDNYYWLERELAQLPMGADLHALELILQPDQQVAARTWRGAEQLQATTTPEGATFPSLLQQPGPKVAGEALTPLQSPTAHDWLREPEAAFEVLKKHLPADAKILKLRLEHDSIDITIAGPIPAFDNDPPAASGDMEYDEYGIPDRSWWYPREIYPDECHTGQSLDVVTRGFTSQWQTQAHYLWLSYDCKYGYSLKHHP